MTPEITCDSGPGLSFTGDSDYYSLCFENTDVYVPGNVEPTQNMGDYAAYSQQQFSASQFGENERTPFSMPPQAASPMGFSAFGMPFSVPPQAASPMAFRSVLPLSIGEDISGANPTYPYLSTDKQSGYEDGMMNYNDSDSVGFGQSYDPHLFSQPFVQRDIGDDFGQSIFGSSLYGGYGN
ncbi:unnamed protein product [Cuscuta europaea]|uniref:Uncharacterized protein n=1 Tax=Cuscuta europaea TaxID=41803 RepID=A0A9P0YNY6_CUSEU|nr:unnamed protein product [Cuscuta europaea]